MLFGKKVKSFDGIVSGLSTMVQELTEYEAAKRQEVLDNAEVIAKIQESSEVATDEADKSANVIGNLKSILGTK